MRAASRVPGRRLSLSLVLACATAGCAGPAPRAAILSTDAGCEIDDQWAIAYLVLAAEDGDIDLRGIVTTHAPNLAAPAAETSARAARDVIDLIAPRRPPPVIAGESTPVADPPLARGGPAARFIVEQSREFGPERRLVVLAIGAATDVAEAVLLEPEVAGRIEVIAMAFEGWPEGRDPWNVKNDPAAYRVLLASGVPLTIGCAEVCVSHLTLDRRSAAARLARGGKLGDDLERSLDSWLTAQAELCRSLTGRVAWPIWDLIAAGHLLGMTEMAAYPRPGLRDDLTFEPGGGRGTIRWITRLDDPRLWRDFQEKLRRHARAGR